MFIQEDIGGESLDKLLQSRRLTFKEFSTLAMNILDCIIGIHNCNIIHKNINPSNIILKYSISVQS